ncbi:hypothetical protein M3Y98_00291300 [Aphelenchoides besseyi]|nr:hypothetical protein M3Y98_00291300 [Aphelenchoides besseyi]
MTVYWKLNSQVTCSIQPGEAYTLDIYMGNTEEYDYSSSANKTDTKADRMARRIAPEMKKLRCLRKNNVFIQKWETDQYHERPGAVKRTLIHFLANEPIVRFECQIKIIHCGGCAEQSCERRPTYNYYPTYDMPLSCTYPIGPVPPQSQPYPIQPFPYQGPNRDCSWWDGGGILCIPWWLWLLFLILLLLLLCCLVGIVVCCLVRRRRSKRNDQSNYIPPPPPEKRVYTVDGAVQTLPEYKQVAQQVDLHDANTRYHENSGYRNTREDRMNNLRQVDQHGSVELRHENPQVHRTAAYDNPHFYDGDYYEENGQEQVITKHYENYNTPRRENQQTKYVNETTPRFSNTTTQQRLQRELEEHLRHQHYFQDRSEEFVERIEEQLRSQYHSELPQEAFREETVRTMRQSSVI